jgi:hypothetical protein
MVVLQVGRRCGSGVAGGTPTLCEPQGQSQTPPAPTTNAVLLVDGAGTYVRSPCPFIIIIWWRARQNDRNLFPNKRLLTSFETQLTMMKMYYIGVLSNIFVQPFSNHCHSCARDRVLFVVPPALHSNLAGPGSTLEGVGKRSGFLCE